MPTLKQITCTLELAPTNTPLKEHGVRYSDGHVETFVAVPATAVPFSLHLKTSGYIAPGLAFFVFIDGEYQANRNRVGLKLPVEGVGKELFETEFRLRQKEEKTAEGGWVAREWCFAELNRVDADKAPNLNPQFLNNVGTIEVVALRCTTEGDEPPPPRHRQLSALPDRGRAREASVRQAPPGSARSAAPKKTATPPANLGGMFGLFDGACDEDAPGAKGTLPAFGLDSTDDEDFDMLVGDEIGGGEKPDPERKVPSLGFDGANDDYNLPVVGLDDMSEPPAPPGKRWSESKMKWVDKTKRSRAGSSAVNEGRDSRSTVWREAEKKGQPGRDQLDGFICQPGVVINQWSGRARNDVQGDKMLGLKEPVRGDYKQYMRENGDSISNAPHRPWNQEAPRHKDGRFQMQAGGGQQHAASSPLGYGILDPRDSLKELSRRFAGLNADQIPFEQLSDGVQCLLPDLETLRQGICQLQQQNPQDKLTRLGREISEMQDGFLSDQGLVKHVNQNDIQSLQTFLQQAGIRQQLLEHYYTELKGIDAGFKSWPLEERIDFARQNARAALDRIQQLNTQNRPAYQGDRPVGAPGNGIAHSGNQANTRPGWQAMGQGSVAGGRGKSPPRQDWSKPRDITKSPSKKGSCVGSKNDVKSQKSSGSKWKNKEQGGGWGGSQKQQDNPWGNNDGNQQQTGEWGGNDKNNNDDRTNNWGGDNGNNNGWGDGGGGGQTNKWDSGNNGNDNDNGWGNQDNHSWNNSTKTSSRKSSTKSSHAPSTTSTRSHRTHASQTSSRPSDSAIKPYFQTWNQPFSPLAPSPTPTPSNPASPAPPTPRNPYAHPAIPLPSFPPAPTPSTSSHKKSTATATHATQTSRGAPYAHRTRAPRYLDSMETPYAVFSFKYRSREVLEEVLGVRVGAEVRAEGERVRGEMRRGVVAGWGRERLVREVVRSGSGLEEGEGEERGGGERKDGNKRKDEKQGKSKERKDKKEKSRDKKSKEKSKEKKPDKHNHGRAAAADNSNDNNDNSNWGNAAPAASATGGWAPDNGGNNNGGGNGGGGSWASQHSGSKQSSGSKKSSAKGSKQDAGGWGENQGSGGAGGGGGGSSGVAW